jgi:hypothetical protein
MITGSSDCRPPRPNGGRIENADIGEQLFGGEAIGRAAFHGIGPGPEIRPHGIYRLVAASLARSARPAMDEARRNAFVDISAFGTQP